MTWNVVILVHFGGQILCDNDRQQYTLRHSDVLYVPSIQRNWISMSILDRDGFSCTFGDNRCVIRCDGDLICYTPLHDELYLLSQGYISVMNVSDINHKHKRG